MKRRKPYLGQPPVFSASLSDTANRQVGNIYALIMGDVITDTPVRRKVEIPNPLKRELQRMTKGSPKGAEKI